MLHALGHVRALDSYAAAPDTVLGRVIRVDRGAVTVVTAHGVVRASLGGGLLGFVAADPTQAPTAGDWVVLRRWPDGPTTVEHLVPRRTALVRRAAGRSSRLQVLAANLDLVGVVVGLHPEPRPALVERLVALALDSGARPVLVLTKADLVRDAGEIAADLARDVGGGSLGVPTLVTSTVSGQGVEAVRQLLDGRLTLGLLGASGHGKSSLANALVGGTPLRTRDIRDDGRGRHTSTRRELLLVPGGGAVVDTPGLRGVGLVEHAGITEVFADVDALAAACRFADCRHTVEPGCAVLSAVRAGRLQQRRYERWAALRDETAAAEARRRARRLPEV